MRWLITFAVCAFLLLSGCGPQVESPNSADQTAPALTAGPSVTPTPIPTKSIPPSPDLTGETFTIYVIASTDEPFNSVTRAAREAIEDYAAYLNAQGGINGAGIDFQYAEVDGTGAGALSAYELFAERDDILTILMLSPVNQGLYDLINEQDIPVIYFGIGAYPLERVNRGDRLFWLVPTPSEQLAFWMDYAIANWDELGPEGQRDVMRLNYLSWSTSLEDLDRLAGMRTYLEEENIRLVKEGYVNPSPNGSASNPILDGVFVQSTMIYADLFAYGPAILLNDLSYLNLGDFFLSGGGSWALGSSLEEYITTPSSSTPFYASHPLAWWSETTNPGIVIAEDVLDHAGGENPKKELVYLYALGAMDLVVHGIEVSLEEYEDEETVELEPRDVYTAISEFEDYAVLGGLMTVDFASGERTPTEMRVWKYVPSEGLVLESDYLPVPEIE